LVRRWQACQRQASRRREPEAKAQHAEAERERRKRAKSATQPPRGQQVTPDRGHAANGFFLRLFASGLAAMNHQPRPSALRRAIVALLAERRYTPSWIASASG
jgi:hypothetical protein